MKKLGFVLMVVLLVASGAFAMQPPAQEGFVPVDQLPGQEELPAAPLVAAAYGVAWAAVLVFVWSVWRRLARVERELADVRSRMNTDQHGRVR